MKILHNWPLGACAALVIASAIVAPTSATPGNGFAPNLVVTGEFGTIHENTPGEKTGHWGLNLKTLDNTAVSADRLVIQPGGYSGWHAHPAPVFVTVTQGSIIWFDGSNPLCTSRTYTVGESFIESAFHVHNVQNASNSTGAEYIAITIKPATAVGPAFRLDRPEPSNCNF